MTRFHSKFHKKSHHTLPTVGFPDSANDPIASLEEPFMGDFHVAGGINAIDASFTSLSTNDIITDSVITETLSANTIQFDSIGFQTLSALHVTADTGIFLELESQSVSSVSLTSDEIFADTLNVNNIIGTIPSINAVNGTFTGLTTASLAVASLTVQTLNTQQQFSADIYGNSLNIAGVGTINTVNSFEVISQNISTPLLSANTITCAMLSADGGNYVSLSADESYALSSTPHNIYLQPRVIELSSYDEIVYYNIGIADLPELASSDLSPWLVINEDWVSSYNLSSAYSDGIYTLPEVQAISETIELYYAFDESLFLSSYEEEREVGNIYNVWKIHDQNQNQILTQRLSSDDYSKLPDYIQIESPDSVTIEKYNEDIGNLVTKVNVLISALSAHGLIES